MVTHNLITSALPYVNGIKHLGNLVGCMLPADVYARFCRQKAAFDGAETLFICATDDHGTPTELTAQKEGRSPAESVAQWHEVQKSIYSRFGLSFDHFGSSSRAPNHALTQHMARKLNKAGLLDVRTEKMLYSPADNRFLPDRYVEGECPHCHYAKARGDQCDGCGRVLDPTDLINPYSAISGSRELELRETKHLYFRQSDPDLLARLTAWVDNHHNWPLLSKSIARKWLEEGLQDRGITRDIKWGVQVPTDTFGNDFANKVFYVWFDAPIGYIAATQEWAEKNGETISADAPVPLSPSAARWWYGNDAQHNVHYTEFMGKDNVYFHTMSFPATLLGTNEPWKLVDTLKSFNWLTYFGGKFSTSQGVGIFTDAALELFTNSNGPDYWRYYLMARAPESDDSSFTWKDLQSVVNKDLADVLGNFINRSLQLSHKYFGDTIPTCGTLTEADHTMLAELDTLIQSYTAHMDAMEMRKSVEKLRAIWVLGNEYLAAQEPWKVMKEDQARAATILHLAINLIPVFARLMAPIMPFTAGQILAIFDNADAFMPATPASAPVPTEGLPAQLHKPWPWLRTVADMQRASTRFSIPPVLFAKITDEQVAEWEARFGAPSA